MIRLTDIKVQLVVLTLVGVGLGYGIHRVVKGEQSARVHTNQIITSSINGPMTQAISEDLSDLLRGIDAEESSSGLSNFYWRQPDGNWIGVAAATSTSTKISLQSENNLVSLVDDVFVAAGFSKDEHNTVEVNLGDTAIDKFFGYEREATKCHLVLPYDNLDRLECGKITQKDMDVHALLKNLFKPGNTFWNADALDGNFARGRVSYGRSGNTWIAKKDEIGWKLILTTSEIPPCEVLTKEGVPKSVYTDKCLFKDKIIDY